MTFAYGLRVGNANCGAIHAYSNVVRPNSKRMRLGTPQELSPLKQEQGINLTGKPKRSLAVKVHD
jgi:hypothetical protein